MIAEMGLTIVTIGAVGGGLGAAVGAIIEIRDWKHRRKWRAEPMSRIEGIVWTGDDAFENGCTFEGTELLHAKSWLKDQFRAGVATPCPCCGQNVKRYARSISSTMVRALEFIERKGLPATSREILAACKLGGGGDHHKLVHWGLIRQTEDGKAWSCTDKGRQFLAGDASVPRYIYVFNGKLLGQSEDHVTIMDCRLTPGSSEDGSRIVAANDEVAA